jgi:hypothetical protein
MPTRPSKGDHGHADSGSKERGNQKATYGSGVSPEVSEAQAEAIGGDEEKEGGS